jgi:hypothetical protein
MPNPVDSLQHDPEPEKPTSGWPVLAYWKQETPEAKRDESTVDDNESKLAIR